MAQKRARDSHISDNDASGKVRVTNLSDRKESSYRIKSRAIVRRPAAEPTGVDDFSRLGDGAVMSLSAVEALFPTCDVILVRIEVEVTGLRPIKEINRINRNPCLALSN